MPSAFEVPAPPALRRGVALLTLACAIACSAPLRAAETPPLAGHWEGELELPGGAGKMAIKVDLKPGEAPLGWSGTIDIPAQGAKGVPLTDLRIEGSKARFTIVGAPGNPTFDGTFAEGKITGSFSQGQVNVPFWLGRERLAEPGKAQDPKPPFPYKVEEVTYQNGEVKLAGTLTTPEGAGPFPAALLITGSGAQDRDEAIFGHRPFWVLADHLSRRGIAVLRVDDRGIGGSTGDGQTATSADFAQDVLAGIRFLKSRPAIDSKRIGLIGHSEGGLIAPLAASQAPEVAFLVLLAGTGVSGSEIILSQLELIARAEGAGEETIRQQVSRQKRVFEALRTMKKEEAEAEIRKIITLRLEELSPEDIRSMGGATVLTERQMQEVQSPWFRFFATFDPRTALRQIKRPPVLVLNGEKDLQVPPDQSLPEIEKALREAGNKDVTIKKLPGLNHLFQPARTGSPAEYAASEVTIDPQVLDLIATWIRDRFATAKPAAGR
jgi:pimeloyl-ACP methyl ester carboxylesterase